MILLNWRNATIVQCNDQAHTAPYILENIDSSAINFTHSCIELSLIKSMSGNLKRSAEHPGIRVRIRLFSCSNQFLTSFLSLNCHLNAR